MGCLLLVRHAESTMNAAGLWQGQADPPLSRRGRLQAARLGRHLAGRRFEALVTSDLRRAQETAAILSTALGLPLVLHPGLREMDVGAWSGLLPAEIQRRWPEAHALFRAGAEDLRPGGGESRRQLRARVSATLDEVRRRWPEGPVIVVTHMGVLRSLVPGNHVANGGTLWLDLPPAPAPESRQGEDLP